MDLNKLAAYFLPAFAMLAITGLTMFGAFGDAEANLAIFNLSLIIIFPIVFVVQGVSCAINHYQLLPAIGISLVGFLLVFYVVIKGDNLQYGIYYFAMFFAGFIVTYLLRRAKN